MGRFPRKIEVTVCTICNTGYIDQDEAENCCIDEKQEYNALWWQCVNCEEIHEDKDDAYNCCG